MSLPATKYPTNMRVVTGTPTIYNDDVVLLCDTSAGAVTINLLDIPNGYWSTQYKLYVIDNSNNAGTNNITINAGTGQTINGASSVTISSNGGQYLVRISSNTTYIGEYNGCCAQGVEIHLVTNAQLLSAISGATLVQGDFYLVTDVSNADTFVLLQALNTSSISTSGWGYFLNADYQGVGDYSGVSGFVADEWIWNAGTTYSIGDVVIWNNRHYKNITGTNGGSPSTTPADWSLLSKSTTNGYIAETDLVIYNPNTNKVIHRWDKRNNEAEFVSGTTDNVLAYFQWGRDACMNNKILGYSNVSGMVNSPCSFNYNFLMNSTFSDATTTTYLLGYFQNNYLVNGTISVTGYNNNQISNNYVENGTFTIFQNRDVGYVYNNHITSNGAININAIIDGTFSNNKAETNGSFTIETIQNSVNVRYNTASNSGSFVISAINYNLTNCTASDNNSVNFVAKPMANAYDKCVVMAGVSTWYYNLDLTSLTIYSGTTLTIPSTLSFVGLFYIVNGGGNSIAKIVNSPTNHRFTLQPADTTFRTITTAIAGAVATDIVENGYVNGNGATFTYRAIGSGNVVFQKLTSVNAMVENNSLI